MAKGSAYEASLLALLLNATPIAGVADNTATTPLTDLYVALHTADPGSAGTQSTSEVAYTGYARIAVTRSNTAPAWTISGSAPASASPTASITFAVPPSGATAESATFFSIGSAATGAGQIFYSGAVSPAISIAAGITPELTKATTITES